MGVAERESLLPAAAVPKKSKSKDPKSRVAELEAQIAELKKKLDARPIVFQFAGADGADGAMTEVEDDMTEAEDAEAGGSNASGCSYKTKRCCRRSCRCINRCRKLRCIRCVEQRLRLFLQILSQRPLLMWLFYLQLIICWSLEISRHA